MRTKIGLALLMALPLASFTQDSKQNAPEAKASPAAVRPNPDANGIYHVGDGVTAPKLIYQVALEFSDKARKKRFGGDSYISFVVDTSGVPQHLTVTRSMAEGQPAKSRSAAQSLDQKALIAVRQYRFEPALFQGKAVPVEMSIEVSFRLY